MFVWLPPASRSERRLPLVAAVLFGVGIGLMVWGLVAYGLRTDWPGGVPSLVADYVTVATWLASGAVTVSARPRSPFGWLLLGGGLWLAVGGGLTGQAAFEASSGRSADAAWLGWVGNWIFFPHLAAAAIIYLLFPDGLFPDGSVRRSRWLAWVVLAIVSDLVGMLLLALTPGRLASSGPLAHVNNPIGGTNLATDAFPVAVIGLNVAFIAGLVALWRRRHAGSQLRHLLTLVFVLAITKPRCRPARGQPTGTWCSLTVPVTIGLTGAIFAGIIWSDLWDVRRTVGRVLVSLILSALIVAAFVGIVAAAQALVGNELIGAAVAALLVCVCLRAGSGVASSAHRPGHVRAPQRSVWRSGRIRCRAGERGGAGRRPSAPGRAGRGGSASARCRHRTR